MKKKNCVDSRSAILMMDLNGLQIGQGAWAGGKQEKRGGPFRSETGSQELSRLCKVFISSGDRMQLIPDSGRYFIIEPTLPDSDGTSQVTP